MVHSERRACADETATSGFNAQLESHAQSTVRIEDEIKVDVLSEGTSSRWVKRSTVDEVPVARVNAGSRNLVEGVLDGLSLHRRLPVIRCETDPRVLQFFLAHPDVAVGMWRAMGVSDMRLDLLSPDRYRSDGGDGSVGVITVLLNDGREHLIHCQGTFQSPVLSRPIQASALFWLRTEQQRDAQGREYMECTADVFIAIPSHTLQAAARILSPVSNRIADQNFQEVAMFIRMMHLAMTRQPGWVEQTAAALQGVPAERGQALVDTAAHVYVDAQKRVAQADQKSLTPEGLRLPTRSEPEATTAPPSVVGPPSVTELPIPGLVR